MRSRSVLLFATLFAGSCDRGTAPNGPEPTEATSASSAEGGSEAPMGLTGVLSEDEFKALHELNAAAAPTPRGQMIELAGTRAYLSLPAALEPPLPAVIVVHEWWGLNEHIQHWTDRLAADGYAALAVDLYGGEVATTPEQAMELMKGVDEVRAEQVLRAAHQWLGSDPRVKASRRASIGWCFGGGWSLRTAMMLPDLDAAIVYYGRLVTDPQALAGIRAPVMGVFGNQDEGIPPAAVDEFAAAMKKADKSLELHRFDANHAFANPSSARYDHEAAARAWEHTRAFLARHLRGE